MLNFTCIFLHHCPTSFRVCRFPVKVISCQFSCGYTHVLLDSLYPYSHPVSTACTSFKILSFLSNFKSIYTAFGLLCSCVLYRETSVHTGPHSAQRQFLVHITPKKQHGFWLHYHRRRRTRRVPTGQEHYSGWACSR